MFGIGLVLAGCKLILRFAERYYSTHRGDYDTAQQNALDALFNAARAVQAIVTKVVAP